MSRRNLHAVGIAHHVVAEHDAAHPRQLHANGLQRIRAANLESFAPFGDQLARGVEPGVSESSVGPVAVREQNTGQLAALAGRPVKAAGDEVAGIAFEINPFDGVAIAIDLASESRRWPASRASATGRLATRMRRRTCSARVVPLFGCLAGQ